MEYAIITWIIPVVSILIALAGLGFGLYQHVQKEKLEKQVSIESKIKAIISDFHSLSFDLRTGGGIIKPEGSDAFSWVIKHGIPHGDVFDIRTNEKVFSILYQIDLVFDEISKSTSYYYPNKSEPFFLHLEVTKLRKEVIYPMNSIFHEILTENKMGFSQQGEAFLANFERRGLYVFDYWETIYRSLLYKDKPSMRNRILKFIK